MSYILKFEFDGLTEDEQFQLIKRLELIKCKVYPELDIDYSCLHRENRVWIDQDIADDKVALELFRLLSNVKVDKAYDDWYKTGVDSHVDCSLIYSNVFQLD